MILVVYFSTLSSRSVMKSRKCIDYRIFVETHDDDDDWLEFVRTRTGLEPIPGRRHARIRASTFPRTGDRRSRTRACNTDLSPPRVGGEKTERLSAVGFSPYAHARSRSSLPPSSSLAKHVPNLEQRRRHANPWDLGPDASILPVFRTRATESVSSLSLSLSASAAKSVSSLSFSLFLSASVD